MSLQQHYDWGLRALKTILKSCGSLLQSIKKQNKQVDSNEEMEIIVKVARFNTMSKLTFSDSKRFDALLKDIFPNVKITDFDYVIFVMHLLKYLKLISLYQVIYKKKALEVFEQLRQRIGVVVVGPSGSGKSVLWKVLKEALIKVESL